MNKKVFIKSYGCQMNVYDSTRMADVLAAEGYEQSETPEGADLIVLNTCHIREKAAEKVYSDIGRMRLQVKSNADGDKEGVIAVAGCVAQAEGKEMMRRAPSVDLVLGPQTYHRLPDLLKQVDVERKTAKSGRVVDTDFPVEAKFDFLPKTRRSVQPAAFLSVQEGCDKFCTYCVVPYTRGAEYSRAFDAVMEEARSLVDAGTVEITLLGQNVNAYHGASADGTTRSLADLIRELAAIEGLERIRFTTSHPKDMQDDLIAIYGEEPKCMPYLHLPVQSGSNRILEAMNRHHTRETYLATLAALREVRPDIALSGDFIVGFPGETDADFEDTLSLVREVKYAQAYSFKYSARPGTPAAEMSGQVAEEVKSARLQALQELLNQHQAEFNEASIGRRVPVLFERTGREPGQLVGRSPYMQAVHVQLDAHQEGEYTPSKDQAGLMGQIGEVEIISAGPNSLKGQLIN